MIMLVGCGFKLQGKHELPSYMKKLAISAENSNDTFYVQLRSLLRDNGVILVSRPKNKDSAAMLEVDLPTITEQIHSYDSKGQVSQYRLVATCNYKLFDANGSIMRQNVINRSRTYGLMPNQLLSNASEQQIITEELHMEIINELLRQLSSKVDNINKMNIETQDKDDPNCPC